MELRSKPLNFLKCGDRICLVSCASASGKARKVLAILEFEHCIPISRASIPKYFALHCVSQTALESIDGGGNQAFFGWQFSLVHIFADRPALDYTRGQVWVYFSCQPSGEVHTMTNCLSLSVNLSIYPSIHLYICICICIHARLPLALHQCIFAYIVAMYLCECVT